MRNSPSTLLPETHNRRMKVLWTLNRLGLDPGLPYYSNV
uniref:Uncharacterized protein n=1 Tax=Rhizophora mucronata TaxID=61149 RepID=A0A2P2QPI2_RHIMU